MKTLIFFPNYLLFPLSENFLSGLIYLSDELEADYFIPIDSITKIGILNYLKNLIYCLKSKYISKHRLNYKPKIIFSYKKTKNYDLTLIINIEQDLIQKNLPSLKKIKSQIGFHTFEYHYKTEKLIRILKTIKPKIILSYGRQEKKCNYFKNILDKAGLPSSTKYIPFYFGYSTKYIPTKEMTKKRKYNCCLLGSFQPLLIEKNSYHMYAVFFNKKNISHTHLTRKKLQEIKFINKLNDNALFHPRTGWKSTERMSYDNKDILKNSNFFINDLSILNFPPARLFEGIACGSIPVDYYNDIYIEMGFKNNENIIFIEEGKELEQILKLQDIEINKLKHMRFEVIKLAKEKFSQQQIACDIANKLRELLVNL